MGSLVGLPAHLPPPPLDPDSQEVIHYPLSQLLSPTHGGELWGALSMPSTPPPHMLPCLVAMVIKASCHF